MNKTWWVGLFLLGFMVWGSPRAHAAGVPSAVHVQGVLRAEAGGLESGTFGFTLRLYNGATSLTPLYTETQGGVAVESGVFNLRVGLVQSLDGDLFANNSDLYLGVEVEGDPNGELPRIPLGTTPYAFQAEHADHATNADTLNGLEPSAYQPALTASTPLRLLSNVLSLDVPGCTAGQFLQRTATGWTCVTAVAGPDGGVPAVLEVVAQDGLSSGGAGGQVTVGLQACSANEVLKVDSTGQWICAPDANSGGTLTQVNAATGGGTRVDTAAGVVSVALLACGDGEFLRHSTAQGWQCTPDVRLQNVTTGAGTGLSHITTGSTVAMSLMTCSDNQVLKYVGGAWGCSADVAGVGTLTGINTPTSGGLRGGATSGTPTLELLDCPANQLLKVNNNGDWVCATDANDGDITGVTAGTGLSGGGASGAVTLSVAPAGITHALLGGAAVESDNVLDGTLTNDDISDLAAIEIHKLKDVAGLSTENLFTGKNGFTGTLFVDTGAGANLAFEEDAFSRNGGVLETLAFRNSGGAMKVQLQASTADGAPLNIPTGATPSAPVTGDVWNGGGGSLQVRQGNATQRLTGVVCSVLGPVTVATTAVAGNTVTQDVGGACAIPAAALVVGRAIRITLGSSSTANAAGDTIGVRFKLAGTVVAQTATNLPHVGAPTQIHGSMTMTVLDVTGATATVWSSGFVQFGARTPGLDQTSGGIAVSLAADLQVAHELQMRTTDGTADSYTFNFMLVELL
jgi:hypothetical protein